MLFTGELGATTILVVSIAACKVGATKKKVCITVN